MQLLFELNMQEEKEGTRTMHAESPDQRAYHQSGY
jgi:hypothetical protein